MKRMEVYDHVLQCIMEYKLKRCLKKECCKQCRYVKFKGTLTKLQGLRSALYDTVERANVVGSYNFEINLWQCSHNKAVSSSSMNFTFRVSQQQTTNDNKENTRDETRVNTGNTEEDD